MSVKPYTSVLKPSIINAETLEPLSPAGPDNPLAASGLLDAALTAADLICAVLLKENGLDLRKPLVSPQYLRVGIQPASGPQDTPANRLPSMFQQFRPDETWTAACADSPLSIWWQDLRPEIPDCIQKGLNGLINACGPAAPVQNARPPALLLIAGVHNLSNHQRLALESARKSALEMPAFAVGPALS